MIWIFVILGSATLMFALYGLASSWPKKRHALIIHAFALAMLGLAWGANHTTTIGRLSLLLAMTLECLAWWLSSASREKPATLAPSAENLSDAGAEVSQLEQEQGEPRPMSDSSEAEPTIMPETRESDSEAVLGPPTSVSETSGQNPDNKPTQHLPQQDQIAEMNRDSQDEITSSSSPDHATGDDAAGAPLIQPGTVVEESQTEQVTIDSEGDADVDEQTNTNIKGVADQTPDQPAAERTFTTCVLLDHPMEMAAGVFFASLRRSGQRDATLIDCEKPGILARINAGRITLELRCKDEPCDPSTLGLALAHATNWPDAPQIVADHNAHVILISNYQVDSLQDQVVRLHHHAHAALAEFAPVLAVLWTDAGRLVPAEALSELLAMAMDPEQSMAETCLHFREFPLEAAGSHRVLIDTVGLHAFGLPDIQIITNGKTSRRLSAHLHRLAEGFYADGCGLVPGSDLVLEGEGVWHVTHTLAAFAPDRSVVQIAKKDPPLHIN